MAVASPDGAALTGKNHMSPFPADTSYAALGAGSFDAVVIPGGFAPDLVRRYPKALELVREINAANKPVATVCHGGWVAISAGIVKGRKATAVSAIKDDMVNAGVEFVDEPVVTDGNLITSRVPADMGLWMKAVIEAIRTA